MTRLVFALAVACTVGEADCNGHSCKLYTLAMKDGSTRTAVSRFDDWAFPDCFIAKDCNGNQTERICGVASFEFTSKPPSEKIP